MKRKSLCCLGILLLLASCGQSSEEIARLMEQAATVVEQQPDSALHYLQTVQDPDGLRKVHRMNYYLLLLQAKDKSYKDIRDDTVICEVKDYFLRKENFEKDTLAAFYNGRVFSERKDNLRALQAFLEAETMAEQITDRKRKGLIQHNIGGLYYANGENYEEAIARFKRAVNYFLQVDNYKYTIESLKITGACIIIKKKGDSSILYQQQALDIAITNRDTTAQAVILRNMSMTYRKMNDNSQAQSHALQAVQLYQPAEEQISSFLNLAYIYYDLHKNDSATFYANKILQLCEKDTNLLPQASVYSLMTKIAKRNNDYQNALTYQEKYMELAFQIVKKQEELSVAGIQEKYNFEIIKNKNQQLFIQQQWLFIIASLALLFLIGVIFFLYHRYSRQKINLLKANKERASLYAQRLDVIKQTNLFEKNLKKAEKEQYAGILPKIKQIIYDSAEGLTWETLYNTINEQYAGSLDRLKKELGQLTESEFKICCLVYADFSNAEIATFLHFMVNTVKTRKVSIGKKLGMPKKGNLQKFLVEKLH
jgi:tetratricopeptide (TPR) repeat protein/DNA-binding CsgD family transcriptional regulator